MGLGPTPATSWTGEEMELRRDQMNRAIAEVKEIELSRALQLYRALCGALVQHHQLKVARNL